MRVLSNFKICRILALGWMFLIFWLSSIPKLPGPFLFYGQDKLAHAFVFGILAFLFARSFRPQKGDVPFMRVLLITLMVTVYGCFDEMHQLFVPGRDMSVGDITADAAGGFIVAFILWKRQFL